MPFEIVRNDITKMHVDAIVNPTNANLYGTAGVDGVIHDIEGPRLREETAKMGVLAPGECVITKALELPAAHIIHTVGPIWTDGKSGEEGILRNCYKNALELAQSRGFESIAFPLISSGAYGFPKDVALSTAVRSIGEFLLFNEMTVYLVVYDTKSYQLSEHLFISVEAYIDDHYTEQHDDKQYDDKQHSVNRFSEGRINDNQRMFRSRSRTAEESASFAYDKEVSNLVKVVRSEEIKSKKKSLEDVVNHLEASFSESLLRLIDEKGLKDPEVYKKANVTKQTFSKIRNNSQYNPTKQTVLAFAIALQLNLDEAQDLLLKSGFALSKSNHFDLIMRYFFESENYDIFEINEVLFAYGENLLGV